MNKAKDASMRLGHVHLPIKFLGPLSIFLSYEGTKYLHNKAKKAYLGFVRLKFTILGNGTSNLPVDSMICSGNVGWFNQVSDCRFQ